MRAGRLRHRVTLQSKTETRDSYGGAVITWSDVATVYAAIEPLSGREWFAQQQVQSEVSVRIVVRYRAGITAANRIAHGATYYDILSVINHDEKDHMITLMCRQGVSEDQAEAGASYLLLETGDKLLLETGDGLLLE